MKFTGTCFLPSFLLLCLFTVMTPAESFSQVALQVEMSQINYLQYEPVFIKVTMRNYSGHPLAFGESEGLRGKLIFEIDTPASSTYPGQFAPLMNATLPDMKGVILAPGVSRTFTFNLSAYYNLRAVGRYSARAVLSHPQLKSDYQSKNTHFSVVSGQLIWEALVGVPKYIKNTDDTEKIESRKYKILSYFNGRNTVYSMMIEDKERIYAVKRLGFDLGSNLKPQCEIDDMSRLNLLVAASPKVFAYYQYNIDGTLEKKNVFIKTSTSSPRLVTSKELGTVIPTGGRQARKDADYAELKDLPFMEDVLDEKKPDEDDEEDFRPDMAKPADKTDEKPAGKPDAKPDGKPVKDSEKTSEGAPEK